jgi:hypothetical protein
MISLILKEMKSDSMSKDWIVKLMSETEKSLALFLTIPTHKRVSVGKSSGWE